MVLFHQARLNFIVINLLLAECGTEEVDATLPEDKRACFTAIATIIADGTKCNPIFLAQGKTNRCHQLFKDMCSNNSSYEIYHSPGKNTDDGAMNFFLHQYHKWMNFEPSALFLDQYTSHVSQTTKTIADQLNINLVFIPKSATEIYQPLDKVVFGSLKSSAAAEYDDKFFHEDAAFTKSEAADLFVKLWGKVKKNTILEGWEKTRIRGDYIEMMDSYSSSIYDTSDTSFNSDSME